jgi:CheY-like chemotaxis protein
MQAHGGILDVNLAETTIASSESNVQTGIRPGDYLKLTVGDTGCGIPAELVERIFDPFFTTKKVGEGTGLGLSVVHGIVKRHGGAITVSSQLDGGTVFQVLIPLLEHAVVSAESSQVIPLPRGNERILLVDDEKLLCEVLLRMLKDLGYQTLAKSSGEKAYRAFQSQPQAFDLLLIDQTMTDMTGLELARRITRIRPDLPIILCTGFSQTLPPGVAQSTGIQAILHKPLVRAHVATTLRRVLDDQKNAPAACEPKGLMHG